VSFRRFWAEPPEPTTISVGAEVQSLQMRNRCGDAQARQPACIEFMLRVRVK
jgi:hypothetical protein